MMRCPKPTPKSQHVLGIVRASPGVTVRDVARTIMRDETTAAYHLRRLERAGLVRHEQRGRAVAHFAGAVIA